MVIATCKPSRKAHSSTSKLAINQSNLSMESYHPFAMVILNDLLPFFGSVFAAPSVFSLKQFGLGGIFGSHSVARSKARMWGCESKTLGVDSEMVVTVKPDSRSHMGKRIFQSRT
ncbi:hypothetical protein Acr_00g0061850 [Actinidia rufa]|uniref:Uncharacterized protein n=1 Tax=Actinidia rufa TaxID=165716 RepID=A0A7J0DQM8_9ERIC|nr:hypothetical protein Acr_00g0061850 [Actinidia rufa]